MLPEALQGFAPYHQFIVYKAVQQANGKTTKLPCNHFTGVIANAHDTSIHTDEPTAALAAERLGDGYGTGFVFTDNDPFFFVDIDNCLQVDNTWSPIAIEMCKLFAGAAVEVSRSGKGLHIFGTGTVPEHGCKNIPLGLEFYSNKRYVAFGTNAVGDVIFDCSAVLPQVVKQYFSPSTSCAVTTSTIWTTEPDADWRGTDSDDELIRRMLASKQSPASAFGKKASLTELWNADENALAVAFPSSTGEAYDASSADMGLAVHLAFWTGKNCERIKQLMFKSGLVRDKWKREDYIKNTILNACTKTHKVLKDKTTLCDEELTPEPLPSLPSVIPFNYDYLPKVLRAYVQDISERMQCPPDFAAVGVMVMMASIIGRKVGIRPMKRNDWTVIPNLWGAVVGNSGVMKSPTLSASLSPIKKLSAEAYDVFNYAKSEHDAQAEVAKIQRTLNKNEAKTKLKKDKAANVSSLLQSDTFEEAPILKRYITNNASYEALGELLMENPNGLMIEADEIIGLLKQLDASGQEVARSFYLTAADGDKPYTFDRIMRGKGLHIDALCLSIIGGIQPGVLAEYVRQATSGGAGADGLLQRFGLMVYPDISQNWKEVDRYPDSEAKQAVNQLAEWLDSLNPQIEIKTEADDYSQVPFLRFDDDAQLLFSEWRTSLELRLRSGEEHPAIVSHLSKFRKLIPSLALINHLSEYGKGSVTKVSLHRAIAFSEYLESHARRIYSYATRPDIDAAKTLLKRLGGGKLSNPFKLRDIYRACWTGLETPSKAQAAVDLLIEYRHLTIEDVSTGGRPTINYYWNKGTEL